MPCNWALVGEGKEHVICSCADLIFDDRASKGSSPSYDYPIVSEYPEYDNECTVGSGVALNILDARLENSQLDTAVIRRSLDYVSERGDNAHVGFPNQILRVTKSYRSRERLLHDANYLKSVIEPWLSPAFCSGQKVVHLSKELLEDLVACISSQRPSGRKHISINTTERCALLERNMAKMTKELPCFLSQIAEGFVRYEVECSSSLCVEIKMKCNIISTSPFVPLKRSIKNRMGRFTLMQLYKEAKVNQCEWGEFSGISTYDPNQLFSERTEDVRTSIKSLYNTPQNNFRVLYNGDHIYGGNKCTVGDKEIVDHLQSDFFCGAKNVENFDVTKKKVNTNKEKCTARSISEDQKYEKDKKDVSGEMILTDVLTEVLRTEDVLDRVRRFQTLDLLDVEGAFIVFERLSHLCGDDITAHTYLSNRMVTPLDPCVNAMSKLFVREIGETSRRVAAESMSLPISKDSAKFLSSVPLHTETIEAVSHLPKPLSHTTHTLHPMITLAPVHPSACALVRTSLCTPVRTTQLDKVEQIPRIQTLLKELKSMQISPDLPPDIRLKMHTDSVIWVGQLDKGDCAMLLQVYLTALVAKDCSLMICLMPVRENVREKEGGTERQLSLSTSPSSSSSFSSLFSASSTPSFSIDTPPTSTYPVSSQYPTTRKEIIASDPHSTSPSTSNSTSTSTSTSNTSTHGDRWTVVSKQSVDIAGVLRYDDNYSLVLPCSGDDTIDISDISDMIDDAEEQHSVSVTNRDGSSHVMTTGKIDNKKLILNNCQECSTTVPSERTRSKCTYVAYSIGIVDIGGKPTSKIISKFRAEDDICEAAEKMEKIK